MPGRRGPDPSVSNEQIVRTIVAARPPALGTTDIANGYDISRQAMTKHLNRMHENGHLHKAKMSGTNVWWPTDAGRALLRDDPAQSSTQ